MGFEVGQDSVKDLAIWERYAPHFPVRDQLIYLNHAAVAPLCRPAADAMTRLAEDCTRFGSLHYDEWLATYERLRKAAAKLINADASEIALMKNTSEGIATIAMGIDWKPGDRIVAFHEEFPANQFPWMILQEQGVRITWLSIADPLDKIDEACAGARLLSISFVQYLSGYRADLHAIGEICRRRGCFFFVDAIQGLGAFPLDVEQAHIDALSADGHKWLLGPEGCGILYVRQERQDSIRPVEFGWTNVAKFADYASRDLTLRPDAGRYECGTLNTIGSFGLRASLELLLEVGVENMEPAIQSLGDRLASGVCAKGYEVMGSRSPSTGAGIVSFRHPKDDSTAIVRRLREVGIIAAPRQGWIRMAPHFYISPDDIDRVLAEL